MLHRHRARDRPRRTRSRPQRRGDRASHRSGAGPGRRVRRSRRRGRARRDRQRPDRRRRRRCRRRVRRDRRAGEQRRLRLPVGGRGGRRRRGPEAVRHQLLRCRRHDQGGAACDAGTQVGSHRQHLVDDRSGGQPAQRVLLLDQVRARGADRGAGPGGQTARHQGDRDRAWRLPHRLGGTLDEGVLLADQAITTRTSALARL